ncbi:MAG: hypothetical protein IKZ13_08330 [Akkermansia sp.]|nr:hypothetical protein [Akkermansia sp.]
MSTEDTQQKFSLSQRLSLLGYKLLCGILRITDIRLVAIVGRCFGYIVWALFPSRRAIVARNLRIVVNPMLRKDKLAPMVRRNIVRTTMNLICSLKTGMMTDKEMARSISIIDGPGFERAGMNGHTAIAAVPHAGNWEILARVRPLFTKIDHYSCMYRKLSNPLLEDYVYRTRTRFGCSMHSKEDGLKAVLKLARTGGLLGVLSDQFTQEGIFIPYFGKVTGVTPLPALLYKRSKDKGVLFAVYTRNVALGKWEAVMDYRINLPENCDSIEAITMQVNLALEECQKKNILDGFWMHHRWKCTSKFAPANVFDYELIAQHATLPFRAIVVVPEEFEEATLLIPALRLLKSSRPDMQLTIVCPAIQKTFWQNANELITYVVTADEKTTPIEQLESDELYKDGPYDIAFMFSENKRVMKSLQQLKPLFITGFENNPLTKKYKFNRRYTVVNTAKPSARANDFLAAISRFHGLPIKDEAPLFTPLSANESAKGNFIAPFSSLGTADSWSTDNWKELVQRLGKVSLLALPADEEKAKALATELGCELLISKPESISEHLGPNTRLYAVDGLLPQLAALASCPCTIIMASRQKERYMQVFGTGHRYLTNHTPCHPCYRQTCDQATPCTNGVTVDDMLATEVE